VEDNLMGIKASAKHLARRLVGTHELGHRLHALETISARLAAASELSQMEKVRTLEDLLRQRDTALSRAHTLAAINTVMQSSEEAFFRTIFNGVEVFLPRDTVRTQFQCLQGKSEGPLFIEVEENHRKWMMSHIVEGGVFLDVGSATGAMTIPMLATFGSSIQIVAFEPARRARRLLELTLARNGLAGVEIVPKAVSNYVGEATFSEYGFDETGVCPWLPEGSAIDSRVIEEGRVTKYDVEVTTLDTFCSDRCLLNRPTVIKIDVEGFEALVLEGSSALISSTRPWLSIDIHRDPFGEGTTDAKVRALLSPHGYTFERMAHVMVASPEQ